jgi:hypothetical protein
VPFAAGRLVATTFVGLCSRLSKTTPPVADNGASLDEISMSLGCSFIALKRLDPRAPSLELSIHLQHVLKLR